MYQLWDNACLQVKRFLTSLHIKLRIKSFAIEQTQTNQNVLNAFLTMYKYKKVHCLLL